MLFFMPSHMEGIEYSKSYNPITITPVNSMGDDANVYESNGIKTYIVTNDLTISIPQSKVSNALLVEHVVRSGAALLESIDDWITHMVRPVSAQQSLRAKGLEDIFDCTLEDIEGLTEGEAIELLSDTSTIQFIVDGKPVPLPKNDIKDYRDYRYDEDKGVGSFKTFPGSSIIFNMFLSPNGEQIVWQLTYRISGVRILQLIGENKVTAYDFVHNFLFDKGFSSGGEEEADERRVTLSKSMKNIPPDPNLGERLENQFRSLCSYIIDKLPRPNAKNKPLWDNIANAIGRLPDANKRREAYQRLGLPIPMTDSA
jgi:hypothetical protein